MVAKRKLREIESLIIVAQNNAIMKNNIEVKIDITQVIEGVGYIVIEMKQLIL